MEKIKTVKATKELNGFYFEPKQWLGDHLIIGMTFEIRGIHLHLMCIAWQQEKKGYLLNNDEYLSRIIGNINIEKWLEIKPQILKAWKKTHINEDGVDVEYIYQSALVKNVNKLKVIAKKINDGFKLDSLLKEEPFTIKTEEEIKKQQDTIWDFGINIISHKNFQKEQARTFLGKLVKDYGAKEVSEAITQLSLKKIPVVDAKTYLLGIIKTNKTGTKDKMKSGRGRVSL